MKDRRYNIDKNETLNSQEKKELYKNIKIIALPIAAQALIGSSLSFVDNIMVGMLGEVELASVGIGVQIYMIYWMFVFGFTSGSGTFLAQFWGAKDIANIKKTLGFSLLFSLSVGVIFSVGAFFFSEEIMAIYTDIDEIIVLGGQYLKAGFLLFIFIAITQPIYVALRATHQTKLPLRMSIVAFASNTILNYMLIFGNFGAPKLGVEGAAIATMISRALEMVVVLYIVFGRKNIIAGTFKEYIGWNKNYLARIFRNSTPTVMNEVLWAVGTSLYVAAYARMGITEFAAVRAGDIVYNLFVLAAFSMGDACLILLGQKIGEGKIDKVYPMAKIMLKIGVLVGIIMCVIMIIIANPLLSLLDNFTEEGLHYAFLILIVYGIFLPVTLFNGMMITGVLRSGGDTKYAMIVESGTIFLIGVPIAFVTALYIGLPVYLVALCIKLEEAFKSIILIRRLKSGKWINNVIGNMKI